MAPADDNENDVLVHHHSQDSFTRWIMGVAAGALMASFAALGSMAWQFAALQATVASWTELVKAQIVDLRARDQQQVDEVNKLRDRVTDDERHVFRNDERIDQIQQRLNSK